MFNRDEASRIKQEFWTVFGKYMSPVPSADGSKINWVNYHTSVKDVYFRMDAGVRTAMISISLEHKDPAIQELYFQQFLELKSLLHAALEESWDWQLHRPTVGGGFVSRISKEMTGVSVLNKDHLPDLISFFKPRLISLDSFWADAKYSFDSLR